MLRIVFKSKDAQLASVRLDLIAFGTIILTVLVIAVTSVWATTPNPGHPWTDIGNGTFQVANTQTSLRTFTFPDASANVLTDASAVTVAQGGTGLGTFGGTNTLLYTTAANALSSIATANNGVLITSSGGVPSISSTLPSAVQANITSLGTIASGVWNGTAIPLGNGGTNAGLTAVNGGIVYSTASALAISAAGSSGQILQSAAAAAPTWSTATYPATAGTSGYVLQSNGTNFVSTAPVSMTTVVTRPYMATGATAATAISSLTSFNIGLFNVPQQIIVNQLSYNIGAVTTAGTYKICVYTEDGATKKIDVTSGTNAAGVNNVSVSAVVLSPGNYYIAMGCATTCSNTVSLFTSTSQAPVNASSPSGKKVYEGTGTMTSGTCNSTLPTVTAANSKTPVIRLDN